MTVFDIDAARVLARARLAERLAEADAERLARLARGRSAAPLAGGSPIRRNGDPVPAQPEPATTGAGGLATADGTKALATGRPSPVQRRATLRARRARAHGRLLVSRRHRRSRPRRGVVAAVRRWLGRRLVEVGLALGGEAPPPERGRRRAGWAARP